MDTIKLFFQEKKYLILNCSTLPIFTTWFHAKCFLARQIRNVFTLLMPKLNRVVDEQQLKRMEHHDEGHVTFLGGKEGKNCAWSSWRAKAEVQSGFPLSQVERWLVYSRLQYFGIQEMCRKKGHLWWHKNKCGRRCGRGKFLGATIATTPSNEVAVSRE